MRFARQALQHTGFGDTAGQGHIDDVHHQQMDLARVVAAFENLHLADVGHGDAQRLADALVQVFRGVVKRKLELGQANHDGRLQGL